MSQETGRLCFLFFYFQAGRTTVESELKWDYKIIYVEILRMDTQLLMALTVTFDPASPLQINTLVTHWLEPTGSLEFLQMNDRSSCCTCWQTAHVGRLYMYLRTEYRKWKCISATICYSLIQNPSILLNCVFCLRPHIQALFFFPHLEESQQSERHQSSPVRAVTAGLRLWVD